MNVLIYNEERTIPQGAILTDINSLKPEKKYLIITYPPNDKIRDIRVSRVKDIFTMDIEDYIFRFRNAIGIFKSDKATYDGTILKFKQISPVYFNGTNIIRQNLQIGKNAPDKRYEGKIRIEYFIKNYIQFYELPSSYDNLFNKSFFEKNFSFFKPKTMGGKKRTNGTNKRRNKRTNKRKNKKTCKRM